VNLNIVSSVYLEGRTTVGGHEREGTHSLRLGVKVWVFARFGLDGVKPTNGGAFLGG
jgi:hypothetical protein